ncbi:disulfide bond formation protein B [Roseibacterium beibuensis]|uniref:Disulfide bond formation protein B n=1 Tax=[Roseibacterium] beibuensis TaxID=1193142 RepID=A0ABP9LM56_9RHOB|nr:disulfide bond formation protein B [Roseibacterium beibuensis]MCS6626754.1 disulfide bond formation protein B [Roseibacterium beibuensis]
MLQTLFTLSRRQYIALAGAGSVVILALAFGFQHIGGLAPCAMCLWQRWPHAIAIGLSAIGLAFPRAIVAVAGAITMLVNTGLGIYHTGVERDWWEGPQSCTGGGGDLGSMSVEDLLNPEVGTGIVLCDEVAWEMFGLSMASYNALACLGLAVIWIMAAQRR